MKFLKDWILGTFIIAILILAGLFGTSFFNNIHNGYLRLLSTWTVKLTNAAGTSGATGFVVRGASGEKYIMTNGHVCNLAENGALTAEYQGTTFPVQVYKQYEWNDLCAIKAHRPLGLAVNIAHSVSFGENTWVIGHPLLEPRSAAIGELSGNVHIQVMVKKNVPKEECTGVTYEYIDTSDTFYAMFGLNSVCVRNVEAQASTMSIQPGNSGSAAVNLYGSVVAVAFAANDSGTRSYFVPLQDLKDFLSEL